jgi:hypothetical protein
MEARQQFDLNISACNNPAMDAPIDKMRFTEGAGSAATGSGFTASPIAANSPRHEQGVRLAGPAAGRGVRPCPRSPNFPDFPLT